MKKKMLLSLLAVAVVAGGLLIARAQSTDRQAGPAGRGNILQRIARQLQLTADQRTAIRADLVADKDTIVALFNRLHEAHIQLRNAIQADQATPDSVRAASANLAAVEADLAVERLKLHGEIYPLLSDNQKDRLAGLEDHLDTFVDGVISRIAAGLGK